MSDKPKKRFFSHHAKSSAMVVSLAIHAVLIVVALSFVAVTVITKEDQKFEAKPVNRPKMVLKKLQVPVNIKKRKPQKPKLRKRIVVQPRLNQSMPDIKMPEITGVKGGMGSAAGDGLGGAGGVGFSMPEIELFGIKSKGEKIFIILDASGDMMVDEIGGIPAYTIIKSELVRILEELNSTVLFNIAVYGGGGDYTLFPNLVSASAPNVAKVEKWLEPLNAFTKGMGDKNYGPKTLGSGGIRISGDNQIEPLRGNIGYWALPMMRAMEQQADSVFLLSCSWGFLAHKTDDAEQWNESKMERYKEKVAEATTKFKEDNDRRRAKGEPPRVLPNGNKDRHMVKIYFPNEPQPPRPKFYVYTPKEVLKAYDNTRKKFKSKMPTSSGLRKRKKKERYSINVIHFVRTDDQKGEDVRFKEVTSFTKGEYKRIKGMDAIRSSVQ